MVDGMYRDYMVTTLNYGSLIEHEQGFLFYTIIGAECRINEIYVAPASRRSQVATDMAWEAEEAARAAGCTHMTCQTNTTSPTARLSMLAILGYGFKPIQAEQNVVTYIKEL